MSKRYRYITCGTCTPDDNVSDFRLVGPNNLGDQDGIRIELPSDFELEKWSCDCYSTTNDERKVRDLNPKVMVRVNNRLTCIENLHNAWLNGEVQPHEFGNYLREHNNLDGWLKFGFITHEQLKFCQKFYKEVLMLDHIPDIKTDEEIKTYVFSYPLEENKERIKLLKEYFQTYEGFSDEVRELLLSLNDKELLYHIYRFANFCCTNRPNEVEKHIKDSFGKQQMCYYFTEKMEDLIRMKKVYDKHGIPWETDDEVN